AALEDMVRIDLRNSATSTPLPPVGGGVGWRNGVPHIVICMSDIPGCCPFPADQPPTEFVQPVSTRGSAVPTATIRGIVKDFSNTSHRRPVHLPPDENNPYGSWHDEFYTVPDHSLLYERSGIAGDSFVSPSNAATIPGTLAALAALDIAVIGVTP